MHNMKMTKKLHNVFDKDTKKFICSEYYYYYEDKPYFNELYVLQEVKEIPVYVEPELEDGWYLVEVIGIGDIYFREKRNKEGYTRDGTKDGDWVKYKVLAKLDNIKWLDNGVD